MFILVMHKWISVFYDSPNTKSIRSDIAKSGFKIDKDDKRQK